MKINFIENFYKALIYFQMRGILILVEKGKLPSQSVTDPLWSVAGVVTRGRKAGASDVFGLAGFPTYCYLRRVA